MAAITLEELEAEVNPDELDEFEAIEPKEVSNQNNPFANMLLNVLSGGGRQMKARALSEYL